MQRICSTAAMGLALLGLASEASAQTARPCGTVGPDYEVERTPAFQARGVRLDAPLVLRYREPILLEELADPIELYRSTEEGLLIPVSGSLQQIDEHTLHFQPLEQLEPDAEYVGDVALPGAGVGGNAPRPDLRFTTGDDVDRQAPTLDFPGDDLSLSTGPVSDQCEAEKDSILVTLEFEPASDDGSSGSLNYFLYLTRSSGIDEPVLKQRATNADPVTMSFILAPDEVATPVCVSVVAVDGLGKRSEAGEHCFDPIRGSYFAPCVASGTPPRGAGLAVWGAVVGLWLQRRRRRAHC